MMNDKAFEKMRGNIAERMAKDLKTARSWKKVGRNYATDENGQPFTDPLIKSFRGVSGIKTTYKMEDGNEAWIQNSEGLWMDITGLCSVKEVEKAIVQKIDLAEEDYRYQEFLLSHLQEVCEQCDNVIKAFSDGYLDESRKTISEGHYMDFEGFMNDIVKNYLRETLYNKIDEWEKHSWSEKVRDEKEK